MATIFQRFPVSGEKCLILGSKESLIYPFDLGDWQEIRVGVALSLTNSNESNGLPLEEEIKNINYNDKYNQFYLGIKSNNEFYPSKENASYIGIGPAIYSGSMANLKVFRWYDGYKHTEISYYDSYTSYSVIPSGVAIDPYVLITENISKPITFPSSDLITGSSEYFFDVYGIKIKMRNRGTSSQNYSVSLFSDIYEPPYSSTIKYPNIEGIRKALIETRNVTNEATGYFTSTFANGGFPSPIPDAFYIHNPFLLNRIRIHGILIERFA